MKLSEPNESAIDDNSPVAITDVSVISSKDKRSESSGSYGDRRKSIKDSILGVFRRRGSESSPPTSPTVGDMNGMEESIDEIRQRRSSRHRLSNPSPNVETFETRAFIADQELKQKSRKGGPNIVFDPETGKNIVIKDAASREEAKTKARSHLPEAVQKSLLKKKSELINPWDPKSANTVPSSGSTTANDTITDNDINEIRDSRGERLDIMPVVTPDGAARVSAQFPSISDGERSGAKYYDDHAPRNHSTGDVAFSLIGPPGDFHDSSASGGSGSGKRRSLGDILFRRRSSAGSMSDDGKDIINDVPGKGKFDSVTHDPAIILPVAVKAQESALEHGKSHFPGGPEAGHESGGDMDLSHLVDSGKKSLSEPSSSGIRDQAKVSTLLGSEYTHTPPRPHVGMELPKVELKKLFKAKTGAHTYTAAEPSFEDPASELKAGGLTGGDSNLQKPEY